MLKSSVVSPSHHNAPTRRQQLASSLYVAVLNWNLWHDTVECVHSLFATGAPDGHVIVLDNGSMDDSVERLRAEFGERIILIESQTNLGFAGGNNVAIAYALSQGAEWVFLINNDTIVDPSMMDEMLDAVVQHPSHLLLAPLIFYHDEPERIWSLGDRALFNTLLTRGIHRNQIKPAMLSPFIETDSLNACALLMHRSVVQNIGGFDTRFFMYAEDVDLCWRARAAGFKLACVTRAHMWHKVSRSTGVHHPKSRYWRISNQIRFYRRYAHGIQKILLFCFTLIRALRMGLVDLLHRRFTLACTTLNAWRDGWFRTAYAPVYGTEERRTIEHRTVNEDVAHAFDHDPSRDPTEGRLWKP